MRLFSALFFVYGLLVVSMVHSHSGATGIVKERMDAMKDMGDKSRQVANMFKGKTEFEKTAMTEAADSFITHGQQMAKLFPDTNNSKAAKASEALPRIWDEWDDFNKRISKFIESSESLKNVTEKTDDVKQLRKAFFTATKNCSGCHKRFRKPKQ